MNSTENPDIESDIIFSNKIVKITQCDGLVHVILDIKNIWKRIPRKNKEIIKKEIKKLQPKQKKEKKQKIVKEKRVFPICRICNTSIYPLSLKPDYKEDRTAHNTCLGIKTIYYKEHKKKIMKEIMNLELDDSTILQFD